MEPREAARLASILPLPAGITITSVHPRQETIVSKDFQDTIELLYSEGDRNVYLKELAL
jgi:hypothetical protein